MSTALRVAIKFQPVAGFIAPGIRRLMGGRMHHGLYLALSAQPKVGEGELPLVARGHRTVASCSSCWCLLRLRQLAGADGQASCLG